MGLATTSILKTIGGKQLSDKQLKKLQSLLLATMTDIDKYCRKHNLTYNLGGGSCLGAVRHNGFIPWDDDMDIDIPRKDYDYFIRHFDTEHKDRYSISNRFSDAPGIAFSQVRINGTIFRGREDINSNNPGISVDITPIENTFNFPVFRFFHGVLSMFYGLLLSCKNFYCNRKVNMSLTKDKKIRRIFRIKIIIGAILFWRTQRSLARTWDHINSMCHNNRSKYVVVPVGRNHFFGELYLREDFCKMIAHKFESEKFFICKEYDSYLKHMYGDYMSIPKVKDREAHIFFELDFGDK